MEFENEMAETEETFEIDLELIQLQKQKSMPRVTIEEFVDKSSDDEDNEQPDVKLERPFKIKTHYEIDDVST